MNETRKAIDRLLAKRVPGRPRGYITCAKTWVDGWCRTNMNLRSVQPEAWFKEIEPATEIFVDFSSIQPATREDFLLKGTVSWNAHIRTLPKELFCFHGARVLGSEGVIISPDDLMFCEFTYNRGGHKEHPVFRRRSFPKPVPLEGNYLSLVWPDSANYYHWLIESLPDLRFFEDIMPSLDGVFVPKLKPFHSDSLSALGITKDLLIPLDFDSHYSCNRLYVTSFSYGYNLSASLVNWLQTRILPKSKAPPTKKLFISREDSSSRRVSNEGAVLHALNQFGYEPVKLSTMSFHEQAAAFNNAEAIIAPHGAGLANLAFCRPGTRVLEIFPPRWTPGCYLQLARAANLDYRFMISQPFGTPFEDLSHLRGFAPVDESAQSNAMEIPLDKLRFYCNQG